MPPWLQLCRAAAAGLMRAGGAFAVWTLWLGLGLLLAAQLWVATHRELAVPAPLLRRLEAELAGQGLRAEVGGTAFDPTGRLFAEEVRLFLPAFAEPVLRARGVFVHLDPAALVGGAVRIEELRLQGAEVLIPAQLTPSGRSEPLAEAIEATLHFAGRRILITQATARLAGAHLTLGGSLAWPDRGEDGGPLADRIARAFPEAARSVLAWGGRLAGAEGLHVALHGTPEGAEALRASVRASARRWRWDTPDEVELTGVAAGAEMRLGKEMTVSGLHGTAERARLGGRFSADDIAFEVADLVLGPGRPARPAGGRLTARRAEAEEVTLEAVTAELRAGPGERLEVAATLRVLGEPLTAVAALGGAGEASRVRFAGAISPRVLDVVSRRVGTDVRRFYAFESCLIDEAEAEFGADRAFRSLRARVRIPRMVSHGLPMEDGRAVVELTPERFHAPEAFARIGENHARGSYEHDLRTHAFRFLLTGALRPLDIGRWFGPWWPAFFTQLSFPDAPPEASVDVRGVWRQGHRTSVFVAATAGRTLVRGVAVDGLRTRLFTRPGWVDALDFSLGVGVGTARGTFTYEGDRGGGWRGLDLDVASTLEVPALRELLGAPLNRFLEPYRLGAAPELAVRGRIPGPGAPDGQTLRLDVEGRAAGEFRFHDFPLEDVAFRAAVRGAEVNVAGFSARLAEGRVSGNARVWGAGPERRLGFNASLEDASLGRAAATLQTFLAGRRGEPSPDPGRFVQERANLRLNLSASGEGDYADPFSFRGDGNATLRGPELGAVPLLGLLSELFTFTSLRFTDARANFRIEGPRLMFPRVELRGANSAIDASGEFALDRRELKFNAKIFPFQESDNVLKTVVGAVLTPLSNALEVRLSGTLERPRWEFVMGPRNVLRSLAGEPPDASSPAPAPAPAPPPAPDATRSPAP